MNFPALSMAEFVTHYEETRPKPLPKRHSKILYVLKSDPGLELSGHPMEAGDIFVVPLSFEQIYRPRQDGMGCWAQILVLNLLIDNPEDWRGKRRHPILALCRDRFAEFRRISGAMTPLVRSILSSIFSELDERKECFHFKVCSLADSLVVETIRLCAPNNPSQTPLPKRTRMHVVNLVRDYMYKHLRESLSVADLAWHLRLSEEHLCRVFRAETGYTVKQELRRLRLEYAMMLLRGSVLTIDAIAQQCGFGNSALFCRTFKQEFRQTPGQYREVQAGHFPGIKISK